MVEVLQLFVLSLVGQLLGWDPVTSPPALLGAALAVLLGTAAFAALGLLMAGALRAEATLAAANLVYLLLLAQAPSCSPRRRTATSARSPVAALRRAGRGDARRVPGRHDRLARSAVLLGWAALGTFATARTFSWE